MAGLTAAVGTALAAFAGCARDAVSAAAALSAGVTVRLAQVMGLIAVETPPEPTYGYVLCLCWCLPPLLYWALSYFAWTRRRVVFDWRPSPGHAPLPSHEAERGTAGLHVLCASLEHSLPHLNARAVAGGLGKVVDMIIRYHPPGMALTMVHPMIRQGEGGLDYRLHEAVEDTLVRIPVNGQTEEVKVYRHVVRPGSSSEGSLDVLLLSHPWFEERLVQNIYPNPMTRHAVLCFFSLWNQAVGQLLVRRRPDIFHCPDYHTALAPWYALPRHSSLRILLVLHNAEYQGGISTDMIRKDKLTYIADVFSLPPKVVQQRLILEGRLNLLKAAVDFVEERQGGVGVCAVSEQYAMECENNYSLFWRPAISCRHGRAIAGLDNPMVEEELCSEGLVARKAAAKRRIQELYKLRVDPDARLFVSLGRIVRQKGVDLLADVAPWLLETFPNAQLVVIGPIVDGYGHYAKESLTGLAALHPERVYVHFQFAAVPDDLKLGADFCLMPSRDEPFGYVDVEFAWRGAVVVGAQAGGLGKVPGFYYVAQNRENLRRLRRELRTAISKAMAASQDELDYMSASALECRFSVEDWQVRLRRLYSQVLPAPHSPDSSDIEMDASVLRPPSHPSTFRPFDGEAPAAARLPAEQTLSVLQAMMRPQTDFHGPAAVAQGRREVLKQEPTEEELAERVREKLAQDPNQGIDWILESIGCDLNVEAEQTRMGRLLATPYKGVSLVHILVSLGYVMSPVPALLTNVVATEWGLRGGGAFPDWLQKASWFVSLVGKSDTLDPSLLAIVLFVVNGLATVIGTPIWSLLAKFVAPRVLLCAGFLLNMPVVALIFPVQPSVGLAILLVFFQGLAASSLYLFVAFNFMLSVKPDMSESALRMGILEAVRSLVSWLLFSYVLLASPSQAAGTAEQPIPAKLTWLLLPLAVVLLVFSILPGILCLYAPGPYRDDRSPPGGVRHTWSRWTTILLAISEILGALISFPNTRYMTWWLENGWPISQLGTLCILLAGVLGAAVFVWSQLLRTAAVHGYYLLIGAALLLAPGSLLRTVVLEEVSTYSHLGISTAGFVMSSICVVFEIIRGSAIWVVIIQVLNSRWRLLRYDCALLTMIGVASMLSPALCEGMARLSSATFISSNQKELADAMAATIVPIATVQYLFQLAAIPFVRYDLRIRTSVAVTQEARRKPLLLLFPLLGAIALIVATNFSARGPPQIPQRVNFCHQATAEPRCKVLWEGFSARKAVFGSHSFGPNIYGMTTTAKYNCLRQLRYWGGDTFIYWPEGRCQVLYCEDKKQFGALNSTLFTVNFEVWSTYCKMSGQNVLGVQLMEWRWDDIANECERFLGPAGYNMVQISPPAEHVAGETWAVRYQPVSFKLESRAGSEGDFVDMVARCDAVGVRVMVDLVINHMAAPYVLSPHEDVGKKCGCNETTEKESTIPCEGWTGTRYGNRDFENGRPGIDLFTPHDFHHYRLNLLSNCAYPPFINNQHICDLSALPDLDTESLRVQNMLRSFIKHLFEIGVRFFRIDAAAHVYPESIAQILLPFPIEYMVLEMYPQMISLGARTKEEVLSLGALTNFDYGRMIGERLFDVWTGNNWTVANGAFGDLLKLSGNGDHSGDDCDNEFCDSPFKTYPESMSLIFLDNHDSQRARWKDGGVADDPVCRWDGKNIGICRPIYKHGMEYRLATLFMLAWPYGDGVRVMSSYGWHTSDQGPPGVRNNSRHDPIEHVNCRGTPVTSPVTEEYDHDDEHKWVCEHRWRGVPAFIRLRTLLKGFQSIRGRATEPELGRVAFEVIMSNKTACSAFVALHKGFNWRTGVGSVEDWPLAGFSTCVPAGTYCNLASVEGPLPRAESWTIDSCKGGLMTVELDSWGRPVFKDGVVLPGDAVALHVAYAHLAAGAGGGQRGAEPGGQLDGGDVRLTV